MLCLLIGTVLVGIISHGPMAMERVYPEKKGWELNKHQARSAWLGLWIILSGHIGWFLLPRTSRHPLCVLYLFITVVQVEVQRSHGNGTEYTKGTE